MIGTACPENPLRTGPFFGIAVKSSYLYQVKLNSRRLCLFLVQSDILNFW